eukprot:247533_1
MNISMANVDHVEDCEEQKSTHQKWGLLHSLTKSSNHTLNRHEMDELNNLLNYVDSMDHFQYQQIGIDRAEYAESDDDKEYDINWWPLLRVICLICLSSFIFGYITVQTASMAHMSPVPTAVLTSSSVIGAALGSFLIFIYSSYTTITYSFSR